MQAVVAWFEPSEEINYTVICVAHLLFSLICGGLFIAEKQFPGTVDGYWIVLSPCIPFLVWSLYLRWRQGVLAQRAGEAGMDEGGESKKDK